MSHVRQQIRDSVVASLSAISTPATGTRLLVNASLPAVSVYTQEEESARGSHDAYDRTLTLVVESRVSGTDIDDALDALAVEIEQGISAITDYCVELTGTSIEFDVDGESPVGLMLMTYTVNYSTSFADPETNRG